MAIILDSLNALRRYRNLFLLGLAILLQVVFIQFPLLVEKVYSTSCFPYISQFSRFCVGWIPFSVGDCLYVGFICFLLVKMGRFIFLLVKKRLNKKVWLAIAKKNVIFLGCMYLIFNVLWGLNYHRAGSAYQLGIQPKAYSIAELKRLTDTLNARLTAVVPQISQGDSAIWYNSDALINASQRAYDVVSIKYPFLKYKTPAIKKMLVNGMGGFGGFSGYINPFTAEAQVDATLPPYTRSYVLCHEMAHQLGYAAEEEANMIGYLAIKSSANPAMRYSGYHDLLWMASRELYLRDSVSFFALKEKITPLVKLHTRQSNDYYKSFRNPFQPILTWWYDKYLKANSQTKGMKSYSYVTAWLIAYANTFGWDKL